MCKTGVEPAVPYLSRRYSAVELLARGNFSFPNLLKLSAHPFVGAFRISTKSDFLFLFVFHRYIMACANHLW